MENKRSLKPLFFFSLILTLFASCKTSKDLKPENADHPLYKIGIWGGSQYGFEKPAIKKYLELEPDLMLYLGDNVYVDDGDEISYSPALLRFLKKEAGMDEPSKESDSILQKALNNWVLNGAGAEEYGYFDYNNNGRVDRSDQPSENEQRFLNAWMDLIHYQYQDGERKWSFKQMKEKIPYLTTWDDHDFGINNGQGGHPEGAVFESAGKLRDVGWQNGRHMGRHIHVNVWGLKGKLPSHKGIYNAQVFDLPDGGKAQVIMLDNRWYQKTSQDKRKHILLGEEQMNWFKQQLDQQADVRFIVSGIHIITDDQGMESWETYAGERDEVFKALEERDIKNVFFVSGDKHSAAVSYVPAGTDSLNGKDYSMFSHTDYHEFHFCSINETDPIHHKGYLYKEAGTTNPVAWGDREDIYPDVSKDRIAGDKYAYIEIYPRSVVFHVKAIKQNKPHTSSQWIEDDMELVRYKVTLK